MADRYRLLPNLSVFGNAEYIRKFLLDPSGTWQAIEPNPSFVLKWGGADYAIKNFDIAVYNIHQWGNVIGGSNFSDQELPPCFRTDLTVYYDCFNWFHLNEKQSQIGVTVRNLLNRTQVDQAMNPLEGGIPEAGIGAMLVANLKF